MKTVIIAPDEYRDFVLVDTGERLIDLFPNGIEVELEEISPALGTSGESESDKDGLPRGGCPRAGE